MTDRQAALRAWAAIATDADQWWEAAADGPALGEVEARISAVPAAFLDDGIDVEAVARDAGLDPDARWLDHAEQPVVRRGAAVGIWLLASEELVAPFAPSLRTPLAWRVVATLALRVAPSSEPRGWLSDARRREEAARWALGAAGYRPRGESATTAWGMIASLDSLRRDEAFARMVEEERHRAEVAAKLREAEAREAAARYARE